jgi:hypothetical protein
MDRQRARFGRHEPVPGMPRLAPLPLTAAIGRLAAELDRLGAVPDVLTTNHPVRLDGRLRSGQAEPTDPGAAVYFSLKGEPRVLACDYYDRLADNVAALAAHIGHLRGAERHHVGTLEQVFRAYTALPQNTPTDWRSVLGLDRTASRDEVEATYRRLAHIAHPDRGGSHDQMTRLNAARDAALSAMGP